MCAIDARAYYVNDLQQSFLIAAFRFLPHGYIMKGGKHLKITRIEENASFARIGKTIFAQTIRHDVL